MLSHMCQVLWKGDCCCATVVEIVVKQLHSIRFNSALVWCAHIRLAGHCGNAVKNHGAEIVSCNKNASDIKRMKTMSSLFVETSC